MTLKFKILFIERVYILCILSTGFEGCIPWADWLEGTSREFSQVSEENQSPLYRRQS